MKKKEYITPVSTHVEITSGLMLDPLVSSGNKETTEGTEAGSSMFGVVSRKIYL